MSPPIRFAAASDGVRVAYTDSGPGTPLVFVRGWFSHLELLWDQPESSAYFERLASHCRLVTFDCRGNGLSDRDPANVSIDGLTADLEAVMDATQSTGAVLYGMGYGGPATIRYAARHPERVAALVLFGTRARPEGEDYSTYIAAIDLPGGYVLPAWHSSRDDPEQVARGVDFIRRACERPMVARFMKLTETFDVSEDCARIDAPTLVMHARRSSAPFALGREMAASIPGARFVPLEGSDWNPWRVEPERNLGLIESFLTEVGVLEPGRPSAPDVAVDSPYVFRREGEYWTLAYAGTAIRLRDARGLQYLARLLERPGRELHVVQLAGTPERGSRRAPSDDDLSIDQGHAGDVLDAQTRQAYEQRISELREEIEDAHRWDDDVRASRAQEELDAIARQLGAAFGLGGRARRSADGAERMRKATTNRIKDSLAKITRQHPELGAHLSASVKTGTFCSYDPREPVAWSL